LRMLLVKISIAPVAEPSSERALFLNTVAQSRRCLC